MEEDVPKVRRCHPPVAKKQLRPDYEKIASIVLLRNDESTFKTASCIHQEIKIRGLNMLI